MQAKLTVVVHLIDKQNGRILLARKKRGFGEGKLNGLGGKIETGETAEEAAVREAEEELGITISKDDLVPAGELQFRFKDRTDWNIDNILFFAYEWVGNPRETEEMGDPQWIDFKDIPYEKLWADDILWLPSALAGFAVEGEFYFDHEGEKVISYSLKGAVRQEPGKKKKNIQPPEEHPQVIIGPADMKKPAAEEPEAAAAPAVQADDPRAKPPETQAAAPEEEIPNLRKF